MKTVSACFGALLLALSTSLAQAAPAPTQAQKDQVENCKILSGAVFQFAEARDKKQPKMDAFKNVTHGQNYVPGSLLDETLQWAYAHPDEQPDTASGHFYARCVLDAYDARNPDTEGALDLAAVSCQQVHKGAPDAIRDCIDDRTQDLIANPQSAIAAATSVPPAVATAVAAAPASPAATAAAVAAAPVPAAPLATTSVAVTPQAAAPASAMPIAPVVPVPGPGIAAAAAPPAPPVPAAPAPVPQPAAPVAVTPVAVSQPTAPAPASPVSVPPLAAPAPVIPVAVPAAPMVQPTPAVAVAPPQVIVPAPVTPKPVLPQPVAAPAPVVAQTPVPQPVAVPPPVTVKPAAVAPAAAMAPLPSARPVQKGEFPADLAGYGKLTVGMQMDDAYKAMGSHGDTDYDDQGEVHTYMVGEDHGFIELRPSSSGTLHSIRVVGGADAHQPPVLSVTLGDAAFILINAVGLPTSRTPLPGDKELWNYRGRNYAWEISPGGDVIGLRIIDTSVEAPAAATGAATP